MSHFSASIPNSHEVSGPAGLWKIVGVQREKSLLCLILRGYPDPHSGTPAIHIWVLLCHLSSRREPKTGSKWALCSLLLPPAKHSHQHKCMPVLAPVSGHPHGFLHCKLRVRDKSINHYSLPGSLCSFELLPAFVAMSGRLGLHLPTSAETPYWVGFLATFLKTFHTRAPGGASRSLWQILCTFTYLAFPSSPSWKSIIDHLLTHEKTMFKDLMSKFRGTCL